MSNSTAVCALCDRSLAAATDYLHRGSCGHHLCAMCAFPLLRCGKSLCTLCPAAVHQSGVHSELGSVVLGSDSEQTEFVANKLRVERANEVRHRTPAVAHVMDSIARSVCGEGVDLCIGGSACLHAVYRTLSCSAMRAGVEFSFDNRRGAAAARTKVTQALAAKWTYAQLAAGGMTPELLAYTGITLKMLLARNSTPLETIIQSLNLSFDDLLLLGFKFTDFANVSAYPLIVLYDLCGLRALHLLSFHVRFVDFKTFIFDTDARYAKLLDLNVAWLQRVLCGTTTKKQLS